MALFLVSHKDITDTKNRGGPDNWKERGGCLGAVDLAAVAGLYRRPGWGLGTQSELGGPPAPLHPLTPALLGERLMLLSFPFAQVWEACFQID